ncbi:YopX family protein [Campylobacter jejuni]
MKLKDFDFRIWNNNSKTYEAGSIIESLGFITSVFNQLTYEKPTIDYEIELWTGLYDKNGKKIYENDIVRYNNDEKLVVKFINGTFVACPNYDEFIKNFKYEKDEEDIAKESYFEISYKLYIQTKNNICNKLDVIGNAHENAELLK